ncbi:hypothetical protein [Streptomyces sp. NPDC003697]
MRAGFHAGAGALRHSTHPTDRAAARAFRFLGVVPGPSVSLPAAAALLGVDGRRAEDALERLVDAHPLHSPVPGRYRMRDRDSPQGDAPDDAGIRGGSPGADAVRCGKPPRPRASAALRPEPAHAPCPPR